MKRMLVENWRTWTSISLTSAVSTLLLLALTARSAGPGGKKDTALEWWLAPQDWRRDSDRPALSLGEKGDFDDQHIFAPHVIQQDGEFWMYYCGSQR